MGDYTLLEEDRSKIIVVWQLPDGTDVTTKVNLEKDATLINNWKNAGRKARIILGGFNLELAVMYPESFGLLVDTNR